MFRIEDKTINVTRGDIAFIELTAEERGQDYTFQKGDVVRMNIFGKKNCENVVLQKDFPITKDTKTVDIFLNGSETKFGDYISKPTDFWYEIVLNPLTTPQTIIGYDEDGAKIFRLYPEGKDVGDISGVEDTESLEDIKMNLHGKFDLLELLRGKSAYEIAVAHGFKGTEEEWLEYLRGKSAYEIAVYLGYEGTEDEWLNSLKGKSAYQIAQNLGFKGTEAEWLDSLHGKSAYQIAKDEGFNGTAKEWLNSLKGKSAYQIALDNGFEGTETEWLDSIAEAAAEKIKGELDIVMSYLGEV